MLDFNIGIDNFVNGDTNVWFVCAMGVGTVFIGLICLILLCKLMILFRKSNEKVQEEAPVLPVQQAVAQPIENKEELIAAISAAVAEELGTDVNGIRIVSFKRL